jgi:thioredoxin domain-containing protein 5
VRSYLNGKKIDYTGRKSVAAIASWVRKAIAPGVRSVDTQGFNDKLDNDEVVFLLLHSGSDNRVLVSLDSLLLHLSNPPAILQDIVATASQTLLGEPPIYASTSRNLYTQYKLSSPSTSTVPVLLAIKSHSTHSYAAKLELDGLATGHGSAEWLEKWLQRNRFPIVGKLGMDNFYSVMKVRIYIVI